MQNEDIVWSTEEELKFIIQGKDLNVLLGDTAQPQLAYLALVMFSTDKQSQTRKNKNQDKKTTN